jgi:hypothetical protein
MGENGNLGKKCLLLVVNGVNSGRRSQESGVRRRRRKKKEEEGSQEVEENFFLWFFCLSWFVIWHILYLSMHLHVLANVVMLNLLS